MPSARWPALLTLSLSLVGIICKCALVKCSSSSHTGEASQVALVVKNPPDNAGDISRGFDPWLGRFPGGRHGSPLQFLPAECPWTEEPGGLQSIRLQRVGHDWSKLAHVASNTSKKNKKSFLMYFAADPKITWKEGRTEMITHVLHLRKWKLIGWRVLLESSRWGRVSQACGSGLCSLFTASWESTKRPDAPEWRAGSLPMRQGARTLL